MLIKYNFGKRIPNKNKLANNINLWSQDDYNKFFYSNKIQDIYYPFMNCNEGFRLFVYKPSYINQKNMNFIESSCPKKNCNGIGKLLDKPVGAFYKCSKCNKIFDKTFRWKSSNKDSGNIVIENKKQLFWYSRLARTMYYTLGIWDNDEIKDGKEGAYGNHDKLKSWTFVVDIDVKHSLMLTSKNINRMNIVLSTIKNELDTFIPNSYEFMSSGNGMYVIVNHQLTKKFDYEMYTKAKLVWLSFQMYLNDLFEKANVKNIKIDDKSTKLSSAFVKLPYTFHNKYDIISVPLGHDINLNKTSDIKLLLDSKRKNFTTFNINNYPKFYDRYDKNDNKGFSAFINNYYDENIIEETSSSNITIAKDKFGHLLKNTVYERTSKKSNFYDKNKNSYISSHNDDLGVKLDDLIEQELRHRAIRKTKTKI